MTTNDTRTSEICWGQFIGQRILDITQQDEEEFQETRQTRVNFHMQDGATISFVVGDEGFDILDLEDDDGQT